MKKILLIAFVLINMQSFAQTSDAKKDTTKQISTVSDTEVKQYKPNFTYDKRFTTVQIESTFPGGSSEWKHFLINNLNVEGVKDALPKKLVKKGFKQTAEVAFTVCTDGSLCDFRIVNDVHPAVKEEALRTMKLSPNWLPAKQDGRFVKSKMTQKITFVIDNN
jgi:hypothetical protein